MMTPNSFFKTERLALAGKKNPSKSAILSIIMTALYPDTNAKAERIQIELLRRAPAWRKVQMVAQLNETVRTLALSGLRQRHPSASPQELRRLLADLILGEPLAEKVYGQRHT
jgi:ABC-type transport system involved in cytochrome bd biosynthesis fused ATPase/permease subunit